MAKKKTVLVFVLDETGSMAPHLTTTLSGYNEYINGLRKQNIDYTLIQFNSDKGIHTELDAVPIKKAPELTTDSYRPNALTPLNDAVGMAISLAEQKADGNRVLLAVYTDGLENASREYTHQQIIDLIEEKKQTGKWSFIFLGADIDAFAVGSQYGIDWGNTRQATSGEEELTMGAFLVSTLTFVDSERDCTVSFWHQDSTS